MDFRLHALKKIARAECATAEGTRRVLHLPAATRDIRRRRYLPTENQLLPVWMR